MEDRQCSTARRRRGVSSAGMEIWQFLHVAAMFAAVSIFVGQDMVVKPFS
jgi:hypothetical protein